MTKKEKLLNIVFGLNLVYLGFSGLFYNYLGIETPIVRWFVTLLNVSVGLLIVFRSPVLSKPQFKSVLISLPSVICGGLLFKLSKSLDSWHFFVEILFIIGGLIALVSFLYLGKSFSIFPGRREIKSNGFYKLIRHPSYLGEFIMILACLISSESIYSLFVFLLFIPSIIYRIKEEEKVLLIDTSYILYTKNVKWRLIPFVW